LDARLKGKKAIRSYARKLSDPQEITSLNITPMMDMMTIILVFLLKTFTSSALLVSQDQNMMLPSSTSQLPAKQAVAVTVTRRVVLG
jgi:biopolymer transport protein ExbD